MANLNVAAYYRLGDLAGSFQVLDSSGNGRTGSLIAGIAGTPAYGAAAAFLSDPNTSLDVTNGTNALNGGFSTIDNSTQPPTVHNPLGGASVWTYEAWIKNTSTTAGAVIGSTVGFTGTIGSSQLNIIVVSSLAGLAIGDLVTGTNILSATYITGMGTIGGGISESYITLSQNASGSTGGGTFTAIPGGVGSTIFAAASTSTVGEVDIRIGTFNAGGSVGTVFNSVLVGPVGIGNQFNPVGFSSNQQTLNGAWHQVAVSYSASVASIYIDGTLDSTWATGGSWSNPTSVTIGCNAGALNGWTGLMQDVALYKTALSASQIANHFQTGMWFQQQEYGASVGGTNAGRLNKLMAVEGLNSSQMLNVPYPFRTLMYSETNNVTTTSGLNYLQTMSETEPGLIFQGPDGVIQALSRQYQYLAPAASVSQGIFGDSNAASVLYHYDGPSFALVQDDLDVWNNVQVASGRSGAQLQQASPARFPLAAQSASVYGSRTLQGLTSLQFENDSDALAVAENYLQWYATPVRRVTSIMINSWGNNGNNIPQMLQRGLYDRITCEYQGQTPGPQFSQDSLLESIAHSVNIANGPTWATTWQTSPYEILMTPFIFGSAAQSQLAGAASVTGSGTAWILHNPASSDFLSGTITFTVASGAVTTVAYNSTAAQCQTALAALVPSTTVSGGPLNTTNISITFGSSQGSFSAFFAPTAQLTL